MQNFTGSPNTVLFNCIKMHLTGVSKECRRKNSAVNTTLDTELTSLLIILKSGEGRHAFVFCV